MTAYDLRYSMALDANTLTLNLQPLEPAVLLLDAVEDMRGRFAKAGIALDTQVLELPAPATVLQGDPHRLSQVFVNLLENSLRYTAAPGRLVLSQALLGSGSCVCKTAHPVPPMPSCRTCLSACTAPTLRAAVRMAAPGSAWPSARAWSKPIADR